MKRIDLTQAQRRLALAWLLGSGLAFGLVILQSLSRQPPFPPDKQWQWLLPCLLPTLSLILSTVVAEARMVRAAASADLFSFQVSLGLSMFYLALVLSTPLLAPLLQLTAAERVELLTKSQLWLGPVQGLVGLALGAFFVSRENDAPAVRVEGT